MTKDEARSYSEVLRRATPGVIVGSEEKDRAFFLFLYDRIKAIETVLSDIDRERHAGDSA